VLLAAIAIPTAVAIPKAAKIISRFITVLPGTFMHTALPSWRTTLKGPAHIVLPLISFVRRMIRRARAYLRGRGCILKPSAPRTSPDFFFPVHWLAGRRVAYCLIIFPQLTKDRVLLGNDLGSTIIGPNAILKLFILGFLGIRQWLVNTFSPDFMATIGVG
jgi:hypothetical protein